ncbi:lysyl oxidase homolog 4-like [Sycon ciliatum]|uniref:lysyl oxidase homolog 4-like n=1 Tax=Sycon ciliatum TaxID=27933 RepID=UPI0031F65116
MSRVLLFVVLLALVEVISHVSGGTPPERLRLSISIPATDRCRALGQGYVVINRMDIYGRVCTTGWDLRDATVVCRAMGYTGALPLDTSPEHGCPGSEYRRVTTTHRYWLSNVQCHGNESSLEQCAHDGWGVHDCLPQQFAMVRCTHESGDVSQDTDAATGASSQTPTEQCDSQHISAVRLYQGRRMTRPNMGYLQVRVCNEWKAVCSDDWSANLAGEVACRQLGYPRARYLFTARPDAPDRRRQAWLKRPRCSGNESFLHQCSFAGRLARQRCLRRRVAGVVCQASEWTTQSSYEAEKVATSGGTQDKQAEGSLRLRGGAFPSEGRVEVYHDGMWGVVCDRGWSLREANVVCRQLGFGSATDAPHAASRVFGRGYSPIHLSGIRCTGYERYLVQCRRNGWGERPCNRERIASVRCHVPNTQDLRKNIRLEILPDEVGGTRTPAIRRRGLVQVRAGDNQWGRVCADDNWDLEAGAVACRQLGYGYVYSVFTVTGCNSSSAAGSKATTTVPPSTVKAEEGAADVASVVDLGSELLLPEQLLGPELSKATAAPPVKENEENADRETAFVSELRCTGQEYGLSQCAYKTYDAKGAECPNCKFAAVECAHALPDLVPDLHELEHSLHDIQYHTLASLECAHEEGCLSSSADAIFEAGLQGTYRRALLRFTVMIRNYGMADFHPVRSRPTWIWHACHSHYHSFDNFATYDLLDGSGQHVAEGHKASFCLEDTACDAEIGRIYYSCAAHRQGISLRCADIYGRDLDCQWIDITGVPDGTYTLRVGTNPNRLAAELDYTNNVAECQITLTSGSYETHYTAGVVSNVTCRGSHLH